MQSKTIMILLAGVAVGGLATFGILQFQDEVREPALAKVKARPDWMASPEDIAKSRPKKEEKDRALVVGVIGPETGPESRYGLAVLDGIVMAVDQFNARGGLHGNKIEVVHHDDGGDSGRALDAAEALVQKNVVAIFAAPTGWSTFTPTNLVNRSQTVFISIGSRRKIGRSGKFVFRLSLPDEIAIDEMLAYAASELGYRNYALVTSSSYDYSLSIAAVFKQAVPKNDGKIVLEIDTYDTFTGKTDIGKAVSALKAASTDLQAIIFTGGAEEAVQLAQTARDAGLTLPLIGSEDLFSEQFLKQGGKAVQGTLLYATFAPDRATPEVANFVSQHMARRDVVPGRFTALAYDAFNLLSQALEAAGSMKSRAVRNAVVNLKETEGVTGMSRWTTEGAPVKHPHLYRVDDSQTGARFVMLQRNGE